MPYYIGDVIKDEKKLLVRTPEEFKKAGIDALLNTSVDSVDQAKGVANLSTGWSLPYDVLVLATGAEPVMPGLPGQDMDGVFMLRHLADALKIKKFLNENLCRRAVIIGAGFISMEMTENFRNIGIHTTIVSRSAYPVPRWDLEFVKLIREELQRNGVVFMAETTPLSIEKGSECCLKVRTTSGDVEADIILLAIGVRPNVGLAKSMGIETGRTGAIKVNFSQKTSREGVYAAGDCCEVYNRVSRQWSYTPLGDITNKQGRIAGQNIGGTPGVFPGVVGSHAFRVFDLEVAATGLTEAEALRSGFAPASTLIWGVPVARSLHKGEKLGLKLVADKGTGKLLGAQCVSVAGAVGRINALSVALWNDMDLEEIGFLDLAYSPVFGGAWDPIHIAAQNLARKL